MMLCGREHGEGVCPLCLTLLAASFEEPDQLDPRMVMPVPQQGSPLSRTTRQPICLDCAAAEGLMRLVEDSKRRVNGKKARSALTFYMARIATGNDRLERLRLPGARIGVSPAPVSHEGDLDRLYDWQERVGMNPEHRDAVREDALLEAGKKGP